MLRKTGEGLRVINDSFNISVTVCKIYGNRVKIGVEAPEHIDVRFYETRHMMQEDTSSSYRTKHSNWYDNKPNIVHYSKEKLFKDARILLVEDVDIIRIANTEFIQSLGCVVDVAENGRKAIGMLHNSYDLILLDIGLPDISGLEVCKWIRRSSVNIKTPVVFLTSYNEEISKKCKLVGGSDFATKPVPKEKLLGMIKYWLLN